MKTLWTAHNRRHFIGGLAAGAAAGMGLSRFVVQLLYQVKPTDITSIAAPLTCLLAACAIAALAPALRATRVDPTVALRHE
jgi:putative ABC transport system permease protein